MDGNIGKRSSRAIKNYIIILIVVIAAIAVISYIVIGNAAASQSVKLGDNISVYYVGSFTNGTVFGSNFNGTPLNFTVGSPQIIPGFSSATIGMRVGQVKNVTIPMQDAYGPINQSKIISVPLKDFSNSTVKIGSVVTTSSGQPGEIISLNSTNATIDFNSPLAGHTLNFEIKIAAIKK
ncbi:MAG: FKBP-type peptidyl-prolyl cis-trans isomerase [Candidatus Micrarchaeia archaeon]